MTPEKANQLRLVAADIIHALWEAGQTSQLELLEMQARASLEKPKQPEQATGDGE